MVFINYRVHTSTKKLSKNQKKVKIFSELYSERIRTYIKVNLTTSQLQSKILCRNNIQCHLIASLFEIVYKFRPPTATLTLHFIVPELSCAICHVNRMQIAQDNSGTAICCHPRMKISIKELDFQDLKLV
jgi:hypothetical protein